MAEYVAKIVVDVPDNPSTAAPLQKWTPVIGGVGGESGQTYHYQEGTYCVQGKVCHLWGYLQFSALGTVNGQLALKGLPVPVANLAQLIGGVSSYFSNVHPDSPVQMWFRAGGGMNYFFIDGQPLRGFNPPAMTVNDINPATQVVFYLCYPID